MDLQPVLPSPRAGHTARASRPQQRGAALIISLVLLAVMTLLVVSTMRSSLLQLKLSGGNETVAITQANAEISIADFVDANIGRFASGFLALPTASNGAIYPASTIFDGTVTLAANQVFCGQAERFDCQMGQGCPPVAQFDLAATATVARGGRAIVHQGIETEVPAGSC
jgi:hypothetical protein